MANSAGICSVFKRDLMDAQHNLGTASIKFALYQTTATIGPATTAYTATGEVSSAGYTAGGQACTNGTPALDGTTAHWTPTADLSWTGVTFTTDCALAYNDDDVGDASIASFTFSSQTVTAGTFTLQMPTDDGTTGLIRIA
jgi:hypothetical protein